ncbi:MAG: hypothetical protein ACRD2W_19700 [Acidimicrobiales bacterium]
MSDVSIWEHVAGHVPPNGPGLLPGGMDLPDDGDLDGRGPAEPGAADGVRLLRGDVPADEATAREVADLVAASASSRNSKAYPALYERVRESDPLTYRARLVKLIPNLRINPERLYDLGRVLVTTSGHRAPVKLGTALFGFFEEGFHVEVLLTLGRHDEFTWYAVDALSRGLDNPEPVVVKLAQQATGWGRVAAVRHLARAAGRADTLAWMLRKGFRNQVGDGYLALPVATSARLVASLAARDVDDEVLDAGVDIVRALLRPGAPETIDDYPDGARATALVVNLLRSRASSLNHLLAVEDIDRFVLGGGDWDRRAEREWTAEVRTVVHEACAEIAAWSWWPAQVEAGLRSDGEAEFGRAAEAARMLGVMAVPALLDRLRSHGLEAGAWRCLFEQVDKANIDAAVRLAADRLPLAGIATGPAGEFLSGPKHAAHECLDVVLSGLTAWPNSGWPLVRAGLSSPVIRNRNLALRALHGWGRPAWPADAESLLRKAGQREPELEVRRRIERLLSGQPLEQPVARSRW